MLLISGPFPDASNSRNGMVRRVAAVDAVLADVERVYLSVRHGPPGTWPAATVTNVAPRTRKVELNPFEPADVETFLALAQEARCVLSHSVYWAQSVLALYRVLPAITDMHGAVPEEVLMLGGSAEESALHRQVEAFVLTHGTHAITVTDAMARHLRGVHAPRAELFTLPVAGGATPDGVLDKPRTLRAIYSGGTDVWQRVEVMAQALAARPEFPVELLTPNVEALEAVLARAGVKAAVRSEPPEEVLRRYAHCHYGFVLREAHLVNAVASPTKLQEYLAHGVVPIIESPQIGDFEALGYRCVTVAQFREGALPDFEGWRALAQHNLGVARAEAQRAAAGGRQLLAAVEEAFARPRVDVRGALVEEVLRAQRLAGAFSHQTAVHAEALAQQVAQVARVERQAAEELQRAEVRHRAETSAMLRAREEETDALHLEVERLKHLARIAQSREREAQAQLQAALAHGQWMEHSLSWKWTAPLRRGNQARRRLGAQVSQVAQRIGEAAAERTPKGSPAPAPSAPTQQTQGVAPVAPTEDTQPTGPVAQSAPTPAAPRATRLAQGAQANQTPRTAPVAPTEQSGRADGFAHAHARALEELLAAHPGRPVLFTRPMLDWDWPMQQRPHHLAQALGRQGFLSFFCTPNGRDRVDGFVRLSEGCYLTNQFERVQAVARPKVLHAYCTDAGCELPGIAAARAAGARVLYDVIDALHPDVAGQPISDAVWERHRWLLRDADAVIASAQDLLAQVRAVRTRPFALVGNGVDVEHFSAPRGARPPSPLEAVVARGQPVVGYFGALARWFDYGLMKRLALERPGLQLVLLGQDYDGSLAASGLTALPNVTAYGPVPYAELPQHAAWFDVATVPFVLNGITASTSPLKLFEALALGKAVVTTDLRECRQVRAARVARDAEEFIAAIDAAVAQRGDPAVAQSARAEAHAHRWEEKARVIAELLKEVLAQG